MSGGAPVATGANPTLRRRELAKYFRDLRHERGYQREQVAAALDASAAKVSRIESGARGVALDDVQKLSDLYDLDDVERDRIMEIARESRRRGWWQRVDLPEGLRTFIGMEQAAMAINEYNTSVVPGLLQTPDYAAALVVAGTGETPQATETRVGVRMTRQQVLARADPPDLWVVLDEAAITRVVGDRAIMAAQLAHLGDAAAQPGITVQFIPFDLGVHPGLNSAFILLQLSDDRLSDVVYSESLDGALFMDSPENIRHYRRAFAQLRAIALSPTESRRRIITAAERMNT